MSGNWVPLTNLIDLTVEIIIYLRRWRVQDVPLRHRKCRYFISGFRSSYIRFIVISFWRESERILKESWNNDSSSLLLILIYINKKKKRKKKKKCNAGSRWRRRRQRRRRRRQRLRKSVLLAAQRPRRRFPIDGADGRCTVELNAARGQPDDVSVQPGGGVI